MYVGCLVNTCVLHSGKGLSVLCCQCPPGVCKFPPERVVHVAHRVTLVDAHHILGEKTVAGVRFRSGRRSRLFCTAGSPRYPSGKHHLALLAPEIADLQRELRNGLVHIGRNLSSSSSSRQWTQTNDSANSTHSHRSRSPPGTGWCSAPPRTLALCS